LLSVQVELVVLVVRGTDLLVVVLVVIALALLVKIQGETHRLNRD
jgi:hypothetical protein